MPFATRALRIAPLLLGLAGSATAGDSPQTILVLDASGSMWGRVDGREKIVIAREVVGDLLQRLPAEQALGLYAYGHRRKGDCEDIEALVAPGTGNREQIRDAVQSITPKGKTPLSESVRRAAETLKFQENAATVVLVSDGRETCDLDPCAVGAELEKLGIDFTAHVVGFDIEEQSDQEQLRCLADATGGNYYAADGAAGLQEALSEVSAALETEAPQREAPPITLEVPASTVAGSRFEVTWEGEGSEPRDYITIVPTGAPESRVGNHKRAEAGSRIELRAPGEPGSYEVRYVLNGKRRVVASAPIELVPGSMTLSVAESATAGSAIEIHREGQDVDARDFITIVPADAPDHEIGNHTRAGKGNPVELQAPGEPGAYEVRYVVEKDRVVLARAPIELVAGSMTLSVAESATAGSAIEIHREGQDVDKRDFITIVPAGAPDHEIGNHTRTGKGNPVELRAPGEPGAYEVRYLVEEGRAVLARAPIELVAGKMNVSAPASALAGSILMVAREGEDVHPRDFITIVPADAKDRQIGNHTRAGKGNPVELQAPGKPGAYEVRYVLDEGRVVLARARIDLADGQVQLTAPASVAAGGRFEIGRSGDEIYARDYITIVPAGAKDRSIGEHTRAGRGNPVQLKAPEKPGEYEVRYVLDEGRRVLARVPVRVVGE